MDRDAVFKSPLNDISLLVLVLKHIVDPENEYNLEYIDEPDLHPFNLNSVKVIGDAVINVSCMLRYEINILRDFILHNIEDVLPAQSSSRFYRIFEHVGRILMSGGNSNINTLSFLAAGYHVCLSFIYRQEYDLTNNIMDAMARTLHFMPQVGFSLNFLNLISYILRNRLLINPVVAG